jgi:hypothetical protein
MNCAVGTDEPLIPVRRALGRRLGDRHRATLARWVTRGLRVKGGTVVKLDARQVGLRWMTTRSAADRFCHEVMAPAATEADGPPPASPGAGS